MEGGQVLMGHDSDTCTSDGCPVVACIRLVTLVVITILRFLHHFCSRLYRTHQQLLGAGWAAAAPESAARFALSKRAADLHIPLRPLAKSTLSALFPTQCVSAGVAATCTAALALSCTA